VVAVALGDCELSNRVHTRAHSESRCVVGFCLSCAFFFFFFFQGLCTSKAKFSSCYPDVVPEEALWNGHTGIDPAVIARTRPFKLAHPNFNYLAYADMPQASLKEKKIKRDSRKDLFARYSTVVASSSDTPLSGGDGVTLTSNIAIAVSGSVGEINIDFDTVSTFGVKLFFVDSMNLGHIFLFKANGRIQKDAAISADFGVGVGSYEVPVIGTGFEFISASGTWSFSVYDTFGLSAGINSWTLKLKTTSVLTRWTDSEKAFHYAGMVYGFQLSEGQVCFLRHWNHTLGWKRFFRCDVANLWCLHWCDIFRYFYLSKRWRSILGLLCRNSRSNI
jgi:hypothetical protein